MTEIRGKNVFISGPMTGIENLNVDAFAIAHHRLRELGAASVYDPAIECLMDIERFPREECMRRCVSALANGWKTREAGASVRGHAHADLVVQLKGWSKSEGCRTEAEVARACGIPCVSLKRVLRDAETAKKCAHPRLWDEESDTRFEIEVAQMPDWLKREILGFGNESEKGEDA